MFSQPVVDVSKTKIYGRLDGHLQWLVYQMNFETVGENAMVLPIPVKESGSFEFHNMEEESGFFTYLESLFENDFGSKGARCISYCQAPLEVFQVGSYEASFVPTKADFNRLDERFRLHESVWDTITDYDSYGFAVFKLKPGKQTVHPIAMKFEAADPTAIFFPTVHIHDSQPIKRLEQFDHMLYYQGPRLNGLWECSRGEVLVQSVAVKGQKVFKRRMTGTQANKDVVIWF